MDSQLLATAGISTSGVAGLFILYKVAKLVINKRLVSDCCGKRISVGVSVQTMTPASSEKNIHQLDERHNPSPEEHNEPSRGTSLQDQIPIQDETSEARASRSRSASIV